MLLSPLQRRSVFTVPSTCYESITQLLSICHRKPFSLRPLPILLRRLPIQLCHRRQPKLPPSPRPFCAFDACDDIQPSLDSN